MINIIEDCPKCGGEAEYKPDNLYSNDPRNIHASWVFCTRCGHEGKHAIDRKHNDIEAEAIEYWNEEARNKKTDSPKYIWVKEQVIKGIRTGTGTYCDVNDGGVRYKLDEDN